MTRVTRTLAPVPGRWHPHTQTCEHDMDEHVHNVGGSSHVVASSVPAYSIWDVDGAPTDGGTTPQLIGVRYYNCFGFVAATGNRQECWMGH
jgi:hypothetical protein